MLIHYNSLEMAMCCVCGGVPADLERAATSPRSSDDIVDGKLRIGSILVSGWYSEGQVREGDERQMSMLAQPLSSVWPSHRKLHREADSTSGANNVSRQHSSCHPLTYASPAWVLYCRLFAQGTVGCCMFHRHFSSLSSCCGDRLAGRNSSLSTLSHDICLLPQNPLADSEVALLLRPIALLSHAFMQLWALRVREGTLGS